MRNQIAIGAIGAVTPVGDDTPMTMASLLTGTQFFDDLRFDGQSGEPIAGATVPLSVQVHGPRRLVALATLALQECLTSAQVTRPVPVVWCLPEAIDAGVDPNTLLADLADAVGSAVDQPASQVVAEGRGAILSALRQVRALLSDDGYQGCVLLGADSLVERSRLSRLLRRGYLLEESNPDGFLPSEGAVALWLTPRPGPTSLAVIDASAEAPESRRSGSDTPVTARGLSVAIALAAKEPPPTIIHDLSGRLENREEMILARNRPPLSAVASPTVVDLGLSVGELGAAGPILAMAAAAFFISRGALDAPVLVPFINEGPARGAAVLGMPDMPRRQASNG